MRELTELYEAASRFRRLASDAERAFSDGLRVGDGVRRAVRQRQAERPNEADCEAIEVAAGRLRDLSRELSTGDDLAELSNALARGDADRAGRLACAMFAGLAAAEPRPEAGFRAVSVRERSRRGEGIVHHAHLATRLAGEIERGLAAVPMCADPDERSIAIAAPEPIALSPSFEGAGSEIALRVDLRSCDAPVLWQHQTGDLWIFADRLGGPFSVAIAAEADDEWWAASPLPYPSYADALAQALAERSIPVIRA